MTAQPTLETPRLLLRPFRLSDATDVQRLAGEAAIADTTLTIPHPYEDGMAEAWIVTHGPAYASRESVVFAILDRADALVGAIGLRLEPAHRRAELGYWIGVPHWGRGYATEAVGAAIEFGFWSLGLNRIHARHFTRNPASGHVMQKAGMTLEGHERQHVFKNGQFEDLACYGILRSDRARGSR